MTVFSFLLGFLVGVLLTIFILVPELRWARWRKAEDERQRLRRVYTGHDDDSQGYMPWTRP